MVRRFPQVEGGDASSTNISIEGEDMLFALLGGQIEQKTMTPKEVTHKQLTHHDPVSQGGNPEPTHNVTTGTSHLASPFTSDTWSYMPSQLPLPPLLTSSSSPSIGNTAGRAEEFSAADLWARLQMFYEPMETYWGQSTGFVDYSNALGTWGMS